jgi:hypothetical protein
MVAAVRNEYRTTLTVTPHTVWSNVPMDLKTAVESMDPRLIKGAQFDE